MKVEKNYDSSWIMEKLIDQPELAPILRKFIEDHEANPNAKKEVTPIEALSLILNRDLSVEDYQAIFHMFKNMGIKMPCYDYVEDAKQECRPEGIVSTLESITVPMRELAEHRMKRILMLEEVKQRMEDLQSRTGGPLELVYNFKIGIDNNDYRDEPKHFFVKPKSQLKLTL